MALPKTFTGGERLFASDLNSNFSYLDGKTIDYSPLQFISAFHSAGGITLDVDNGSHFSFSRTMAGTETLLTPLNMPEGSVVTLSVNATSTSTAAPVVEARASGKRDTNGNTHEITLPSGIETNDLLLVVFSCDGGPTVSVSSGSGWNALGQRSNGTTVTGAVFWKIANNDDSLTLGTSASEQSSHVSFRISGIKKNGNVSGTDAGGSSTNSNPPSHTMPGTDLRGRLWIATRSGDAKVVATAAPSGYSELQTIAAGETEGASTNTAEKTTTGTENTEDPGTFTSATEQWVSFTIGIDTSGSHFLTFASEYVTPVPNVQGNNVVVQILRLPENKYLAVEAG
jgi:hypothetical protein